jgi:hypothetical protein
LAQVSRSVAVSLLLLCVLGLAKRADGQEEGGLTARTLYYNSGSDVQPKTTGSKQTKRTSARTTATATSTSSKATGTSSAETETVPEAPPVNAPAPNLGVRYNVLVVDSASNSAKEVDPSGEFRRDDCLAVQVQSNYDGYLYVLDRGSSGKWDVLLPSMELPDESNFVKARTDVRAPAQACFSLDNPPGVEHLYLVLARGPQDVSALNAAIKGSRDPQQSGATESKGQPNLETQVARLEQGLQSRDLRITKVKRPQAGEPANAVYVVDTSASGSDRIVTEIQIKHN